MLKIDSSSLLEQHPLLKSIPWKVWELSFHLEFEEEIIREIEEHLSINPHNLSLFRLSGENLCEDEEKEAENSLKILILLFYLHKPRGSYQNFIKLADENGYGEAALCRLSAITGEVDLLKTLISQFQRQRLSQPRYLDLLQPFLEDWEAFHLAIRYGHLEFLRYFIELFPQQRFDMLRAKKFYALTFAIEEGNISLLCFLLAQAKTNIEKEKLLSSDNLAALALATKKNRPKVISILLGELDTYNRVKPYPIFSADLSLIEEVHLMAHKELKLLKAEEKPLNEDSEFKALQECLNELLKTQTLTSPQFEALLKNLPILSFEEKKLLMLKLFEPQTYSLGLCFLYALLNAGFSIFSSEDEDFNQDMQRQLYASGSLWESVTKIRYPRVVWSHFLNPLKEEISLDNFSNLKTLKEKKRLFHACFIFSFLHLHAGITLSIDLIRQIQFFYLREEYLKTGSLPSYELARASGFSFSYLGPEFVFLNFFIEEKRTEEEEKAARLYILKHYMDNQAHIYDPALEIALKATIDALENDVDFTLDELKQSLLRHYQATFQAEGEEKKTKFMQRFDSPTLYHHCEHKLQIILSLIVLSLKQRGRMSLKAMSVLEVFSQTLAPVDRYVYFSIEDSSEFNHALEQAQDYLQSEETFNAFLRRMEESLANKLSHLLPVAQSIFSKEKLDYREMSFPCEKEFQAWQRLSLEEKKLSRALPELLSLWEKEQGFCQEIPYFYNFVPEEITVKYPLYRESWRSLPGLIHGPDAHRIQWAYLCYLIDQGRIQLPTNKRAKDFLTYIIESKHWAALFDHVDKTLSCPHYLMTYLRDTREFPALQTYARFSFFKAMDKLIQMQASSLGYTELLLFQAQLKNSIFKPFLPEAEIFTSWLKEKAEVKASGLNPEGNFYACFFKKKENANDFQVVQNSVDCSL